MYVIDFFKGLINKMLKRDDIQAVVGKDIMLSSPMYHRINLWSRMYAGQPPWADKNVQSMRLEQGICRELANIALNEMTAKVSDDALNELFKATTKDLNENLQKGLALGSFIIRPLGGNKVEFATPDRFIPILFSDDGKLTSVAFIDVKVTTNGTNSVYFRRFEFHELTEVGLLIYNKAYKSTSEDNIGNVIPLSAVPEWAKLPDQPLLYKINRPDFGFYRNPIANTIDGSFCGVSVFDCAIDLIKKADIQNARIDWEFESGERAIHIDVTALKSDGTLSKLNERLYRGLDVQMGQGKDLFDVFSPAFRDVNLINGLNAYLRRIEFNCSLSYEISAKVAPYYAVAGDTLFTKLQDIIDNRKTLDDLNTTIVEVHLWEEDATTQGSYVAYKENAVIEVSSYGGNTEGYQIPFTLHYTGSRTKGLFNLATKTFTAEE